MHVLSILLVVFLNFVLCSHGLDLCKGNRAFEFPTEPHTTYPKLSVTFPDDTKSFAVSMWFYLTKLDQKQPYISYADGKQLNIFLFGNFKEKSFLYAVKNDKRIFPYYPELNTWWHGVYMWDGYSEQMKFFHNGTLTANTTFKLKPEYSFGGNGFLTPGIEQPPAGKKFRKTNTFRGLMTSINLWDKWLTDEEVEQVLNSELEGNIAAWSETVDKYELIGSIKLVDTTVGMRESCDGKGGGSGETTAAARKTNQASKSSTKEKKTKNDISVNIHVAQKYDRSNPDVHAHLDTCNGDFQAVNATFQKFGKNYLSPLKEAVNASGKMVNTIFHKVVDTSVNVNNAIQNSGKDSASKAADKLNKIFG